MKIALLLTGNELMTGDTVDSNSSMIARTLGKSGFDVAHKVTVGDDFDLLVAELKSLSSRYSAVIVNGGLGPTVDDLTAEVLAALSGQPLVEHQDALAHVHDWCAQRNIHANDANLKQALLPAEARVLANPVGSAVGIALDYRDCLILCTPGVPSELNAMLQGDVPAALQQAFPDAKARGVRRLKLFGIGESSCQQILAEECGDWPDEVTIGFRAGAPLLELKLEIEDQQHMPLRDQCEQRLFDSLGDYIVGENDDTLAAIVIKLLQQQGRKLALAESCTGGLIASQITSVAGASTVFEAGIVSYSNAIKHQVLAVDSQLLEQHGAVSEEIVLAMAEGAMNVSAADCAIAVSGVAGPGGGTPDKPVGTVWVAWGGRDPQTGAVTLKAHRFNYPVGRAMFQTMISAVGLDLMRRYLLGSHEVPGYFQRERRK